LIDSTAEPYRFGACSPPSRGLKKIHATGRGLTVKMKPVAE
jgi:hypothetical protein